jgi:hypothetical protein
MCDADNSGAIDIDEFQAALFACDPVCRYLDVLIAVQCANIVWCSTSGSIQTNGNSVGYIPGKLLSPLDAFETFDEDRTGMIQFDEVSRIGNSKVKMFIKQVT